MENNGGWWEEFAVGCLLSIKTTLGDEFDGQVIAFDRFTNMLVPPREELAVRQDEADVEMIGVGVTSEAQGIFDALSKTPTHPRLMGAKAHFDKEKRLPVCWDKAVIVVMNEVHVSSPYLPESVSGGIPATNERVKKVIEFERIRLQARGSSQG